MTKAKWGTKRQCPKCGTRFYDLGKEDPVVCIDCGNEWVPEAILKSRQPQLEEQDKKTADVKTKKDEDDNEDVLIEEEDLEIDEDDDDDIGDEDLDLDDGSDVPDVITKSSSGDED